MTLYDNFIKKGAFPVLSQIKLTVNINEPGSKQYEKLVSEVHKIIKKEFLNLSYHEKEEYIEHINGNYQCLDFEKLDDESVLEELTRLSSNKASTDEVLFLKLCKGEKEIIGYSLLNGSLSKKTHLTMHSINGSYRHVWDLSLLVAQTIVLNALEQFAHSQRDLIQYLVAKEIHTTFSRGYSPLPYDGKFSLELLKIFKTHDWYVGDSEKIEEIDEYRAVFYLESIENYHFQEIVVPEFIRQMISMKERMIREENEKKTYATSFQTKRNIHKKTQEKMMDNAFLTHYGFVEIDNSVSLEEFESLEESFQALTDTIHIPTYFDHSFRLRRLGKQKATGMYYRMFKSTVLDIEHPESYCHELGHQLDATLCVDGELLSEQFEFRPILDLYQTITNKQVEELDETHVFKRIWNGKSKYNKSYYFTPTEVFARSFELYLIGKGIRSILLKENVDSPEYPLDAFYLEKVEKYFDRLFQPEKK